jgi:transposase
MRRIREVLRLKAGSGLTDRQIADSVGCARSTVQECLRRARQAGLTWPLPPEFDDAALGAALYPAQPVEGYPAPDFARVELELRRKGVTRKLLWREYRDVHADGCGYSAFCRDFDAWRTSRDPVMRIEHRAGEKVFVDYAGLTVPVVDPRTGALEPAQIFVAALGASHYVYAEATASQSSPDWLGSHVRLFAHLGGVPEVVVPDNLRSGVARACRYDPELNRAYADLAAHYGIAVLPARVRKPRDKAKVETAVQIVERELLAPLRHCTFFSLAELNAALRERLAGLNNRPLRAISESRRQRFECIDRPALRPLPPTPYAFAEWRQAKVHRDYHVQVEQSLYSVPYALIGRIVDVRLAAATVEVFHDGKLVAAHPRAHGARHVSTQADHRAPAHAALIARSIDQLSQRAAAIGPATAAMLTAQFERRQHPEEAYRRCLGVLRLAQDFDPVRLEQACARALEHQLFAYRAIRDLILHPPAGDVVAPSPAQHEHLRGPTYFQ